VNGEGEKGTGWGWLSLRWTVDPEERVPVWMMLSRLAIGAYVVTSVVAERRETSKWRSQGMSISDSRGGIRSPDEGKAGAMSSNRWAGKRGHEEVVEQGSAGVMG
jgi:hypothetical protein